MTAAALLVAAGKGKRLGAEEPKALVLLAGRPLIAHCVEIVGRCPDVEGFVVVAPPGRVDEVGAAAGSPKLLGAVAGGESRQESVRLGLEALPERFDEVLCHDVARPLATSDLFSRVASELRRSGIPVIPVVPLVDSIKRIAEGGTMEPVSREDLFAAQTPQGFPRSQLAKAHARALAESVVGTDDAELCQRLGFPPGAAIPGERGNIKITELEDLAVAESIVKARRG
jgi:2-C-methyl-D-erythritol 4-phosphate cytidylyltransferase